MNISILGLLILMINARNDFKFPAWHFENVSVPNNYDRYVFAVQWAGNACFLNKCNQTPPKNVFNVHGLWPSSVASSPDSCEQFRFQEKDIDPIVKKTLYNHWNGCYSDNWTFIRHELSKHATCWQRPLPSSVRTDSNISDILNTYNSRDPFSKYNLFLKIVVSLSQKLNVYNLLKDNKIVPNGVNNYSISSILSIINKKLGLKAGVIPVCNRLQTSNDVLLEELRFCLDLGYNFVECDPIKATKSSNYCGRNGVKLLEIKDKESSSA